MAENKSSEKSTRTIIGLSIGVFLVLVLLIIIASLLITASLVYLYKTAQDRQVLTEDEVRMEIEVELADVMLLPDGDPTFAKVTDIALLQKENPGFYKDGKNGDYLIFYKDRAILYRFDEKLIINIAPVKIEEEVEEPAVIDNEALEIDITNGTYVNGAATRMKQSIEKLTYGQYSVDTISTTVNKTQKSYVYDLTGDKKSPSVKKLAEQLGLEYKVGLPAGEKADADVLIIVGSDRAL